MKIFMLEKNKSSDTDLRKYKIHNLSVPLYRYWIHDDNLTKNNNKMEYYKDELIKKHGN